MNAAVMANLFAAAREEERLFPPPMTFFLGTDRTSWPRCTDVPLFFSRRWLAPMRTLPRARGPWALDSGAFTELDMNGRHETPAEQYAAEAKRFASEMGNLRWATVQDWMCEPDMLKKTGLTVAEHQRRTVESYLALRALAPGLTWVPVVQGWTPGEYLDHVGQYERAGVDLRNLSLVGIGSVCRRQRTQGVESVIRELHGAGVRVHAFGFKLDGVRRCAAYLASSDSMAWSRQARWSPPLPGCPHRRCNHCLRFALLWRERVLKAIEGARASRQGLLF